MYQLYQPPSTAPNPWMYYPYWVGDPPTQPTYNPSIQTTWWFTCPHCAAAITWQGEYCPHCGKRLIDIPPKEKTLEEIKKLLEEANKKLDSLSETKTEGS